MTDTMEIVENTYVADPYVKKGKYVHKKEDGTFAAYSEGLWWGDYHTYEEAAEGLFPAIGMGGYELQYFDFDDKTNEGYNISMCSQCALNAFLADPTQGMTAELCDGDSQYDRDTTCDVCEEVIQEQACPECGKTFEYPNGAPYFHHDYGYMLHAGCLARLVVKGSATKTSKRKYEVNRDDRWFGGEFYG